MAATEVKPISLPINELAEAYGKHFMLVQQDLDNGYYDSFNKFKGLFTSITIDAFDLTKLTELSKSSSGISKFLEDNGMPGEFALLTPVLIEIKFTAKVPLAVQSKMKDYFESFLNSGGYMSEIMAEAACDYIDWADMDLGNDDMEYTSEAVWNMCEVMNAEVKLT